MSKYTSADVAFLLVGQYDLTKIATKLEDEAVQDVDDTTGFGHSARQYQQKGIRDYNLTGHTGWYDDSASASDAALIGLASGSGTFMMAIQGGTKGSIALCASGLLKTAYTRQFAVSDFVNANMTLELNGPVDRAVVIAPYATQVASGDTSSSPGYYDLGAPVVATITANTIANPTVVTTSAAHGFLSGMTVTFTGSNSTPSLNGTYSITVTDSTHFTVPVNCTVAGTAGTATMTPGAAGLRGYMSAPAIVWGDRTSLVLTLQDSPDHITFTDKIAFTSISGPGTTATSEYKTAASCNRYLCSKWLWAGGTTGQSVTYAMAARALP